MKNLFNDISQEERNRILEMHQSATRKNYLSEQSTPNSGGTQNPNQIKITRIKTSPTDLALFLQIDQSFLESLLPNSSKLTTKESWDSFNQTLRSILDWYGKSGRNPTTNPLSTIVTSIPGLQNNYNYYTKGDPSKSGAGLIAGPKEFDRALISLYNNQLGRIPNN